MWRAGVRFFSSKVAAQQRPTKVIENLLKEHGPQTVNDCWKLAEPVGIKSKTHMKTMLHWLVERDRVQITCNHLKHARQKNPARKRGGRQQKGGQGVKEFIFGIRMKRVRAVEDSVSAKIDEATSSAVGDGAGEDQVVV